MSNRFLILKGTAGIGNRLITLANAIAYADKTNRTILVDWSDGQFGIKEENVFYRYFALNKTPHIQSIKDIKNYYSLSHYPKHWALHPNSAVYDIYKQNSSYFFTRIIPSKFPKKSGYWCLKEKQNNTLAQQALNLLNKNNPPFGGNYSTKMNEDVVFYADFCPPFSPDILRNHIKLSDWLNSEIEDLTSKYQLGRDTVGIHIRMTDKQPDSDLDKLIKKIKDLGFEKKQVFLATDNPEIEDSFQGIFSNLIFLPKWRPEHIGKQMGVHQYAIRNKDYGMAERQLKESIIDMWLLSKCEFLIYQKNSSFSRVSAVLKNEPTKTFSW